MHKIKQCLCFLLWFSTIPVVTKKNKQKRNSIYTYARKNMREVLFESDSMYLLKLTLYMLLATMWLKFGEPFLIGGVVFRALPLGLLAGLLVVRMLEKHQLNRKILYAIVMTIGILTYFVPAGFVI